MADWKSHLQENWKRTHQEIAAACQKYNRPEAEIKLIAITKYVNADVVRELHHLGCRAIGENRPQVVLEKATLLSDLDLEWHLVGHLQSNKVKRMVASVDYIHSIDSWDLLELINRHAAAANRIIRGLIEVHISGEASKSGLAVADLAPLAEAAARLTHVSLVGFMGMAQLDGTESQVRDQFARLRHCRDTWAGRCGGQHPLHHLSMGMSSDFPWAIAEGATMIRVGSSLFEGMI